LRHENNRLLEFQGEINNDELPDDTARRPRSLAVTSGVALSFRRIKNLGVRIGAVIVPGEARSP
jgi:hypothetical protein